MKIKKIIEKVLFSGSKFILTPFYLGLLIALGVYLYIDFKVIWHMITLAHGLTDEEIMLILLKLVDITMIAALIRTIITGGYTSFVNKNHGEDAEKTSSGVLKVKMGTSLIGVSSISLLTTFINAEHISQETINKQLYIHGMFLIGAVVLAIIDYLHVKSESIHHQDEMQCEQITKNTDKH